jgi:hypothetical protein
LLNKFLEWGEFLHKPGKKFAFDEIKQEIEADTERYMK